MKLTSRLPLLAALVLLTACGGGGGASAPNPPAPAAGLAYADPAPSSSTYQLRKNAALSTASHLVLEVWGPSGTNGCGLSLALSADPAKVVWTNVAASDAANTLLANGTVFQMPASGAPLVKAKASAGGLVASVAEAGLASPKALNGPLLRVALDLKGGAGLAQGAPIALTPDLAKCRVLMGDGSITPLASLGVGTLTAQ